MTVVRVENGDIYLPAGAAKFVVLGEVDAIKQQARDALAVAVGDWFLDQTAGVNREILIGKYQSLVPPETEVRRVLARVPGVTAVIRVRVVRFKTRAEALAAGADAVAAWDALPGRVLYVTAELSTRTAGVLELGISLPATS